MNANEQFISEPIKPETGSFDARDMARGEPGLPARFTWRDTKYAVTALLEHWKSSGREKGGSEIYLRRHWFKVRTDPPMTMTIYCQRQPASGKRAKSRWWVYCVEKND